MTAIDGNSIRVSDDVSIPRDEIRFRVSRSSGPGGQHAQRSETRVEALFDVEASTTLTAEQKLLVLTRVGPVLRAVAQDERSQLRNRELALDRLVEALRRALETDRPRRRTRPPASSVERGQEEKKRRSRIKRLRSEPGVEPE
jgi:ribosome-associated protein